VDDNVPGGSNNGFPSRVSGLLVYHGLENTGAIIHRHHRSTPPHGGSLIGPQARPIQTCMGQMLDNASHTSSSALMSWPPTWFAI
jgi:hypothetical protein